MTPWPTGIAAITLLVEDLAAARRFYTDVFELPVVFEDASSAAFGFPGVLVNLLDVSDAPELIEPGVVADPAAGNRVVLTVEVEDVDATCERLRGRGVELLNGPMDRPWGPRTASFRDPAGHIWEISS